MSEEVNDQVLRKYLLGELPEAEQQAVEKRLMTETELFNLIPVVEDELIDDYLGGLLSSEERDKFESFFVSAPERRRKLSFAMTLKRYITAEGAAEARAAAEAIAAESASANPAAQPSRRISGGASSVIGHRSSLWNRAFASPYLRMAATAVLLFAAGFGIWRGVYYRSDAEKGLAALARAYPESPIEARISELNYPPQSKLRGGHEEKGDDAARGSAERFIFDAVRGAPNAESYHALGRLYLAEQKFVEAAEQLEKALQTEPNNAKLHNDYGAALLEIGKQSQSKGEQGKSFEEFARSNEHLSRALELDNSLLDALFNRALCHEYLRLYQKAEEDWTEYIRKDPKSKWTDEARQKLKDLEDRPRQNSKSSDQLFQDFVDARNAKNDAEAWKLICEGRDPTGSPIENKLIDSYLDLATRGQNEEAREALDALSFAAELEYRYARDPFIKNLVQLYRSATPSQLESIHRARGLIKKGRERSAQTKFTEALGFFSEAKETFERAGDEGGALSAGYSLGNCYLQQSRAELALSPLQTVAQACEGAQYRWLLSQALCSIANAHLYLREFSAAIENSERSMAISKEIGDTNSYLRTLFQLAEEYRFVDKVQKALDLHAQDLFLTHAALPQPAELWKNYFSISLTFYQLDLPVTAIDFQEEALHVASEAKKPRLICRSYNYLGMLQARQGSYADAIANIKQGLEIGSSFTEKEVRVEATAPSFLQLGYVYRKSGDFKRAVENYDQVIQAYDELDSKFFAYTARKEKFLCCMERDGCDAVDEELEKLLSLFEEHRSKILEESNRASYFDAEQSIYDVAIEFEYFKKNDTWKAFDYSERSRGRSMRDLINPSVEVIDDPDKPEVKFRETSQPMSLEVIRSRMPPQAQLLQYAVLKNHILIWLVTGDGGDPFTKSQSIAAGELDRKIKSFRKLTRSPAEYDPEAFSTEAADLYDLLIRPVESRLDVNKPLCIVPDKILNNLSFAALKSRTSGDYFIQRQQRGFVLSASSTMFIEGWQEARKKGTSRVEKILSVGDPLYDRKAFSKLGELQSAPREARTIAECYGSFSPLIGASATKTRVMREMETSDVIHLATHAVTDELYPLCSRLLFAKDTSSMTKERSDGVLHAYEILKLDLSRPRLVVLSACRTGVDNYYGGEGMVGLSRAFIARGIPLVVASLWDVQSSSTADLMISFHNHRKRDGLPTAEALRQAQIDMLGEAGSRNGMPCCWASFVAIGGYADF